MKRIFTLVLFTLATTAFYPLFAQTTITLQPDSCEGFDAQIASCVPCGYASTNYGSFSELNAIAWTNGGNTSNARSLLKFGLNEIPQNATIVSAYMSLYFDPNSANGQHSQLSGSNDGLLRRVTSPWSENLVTWLNQPTTTTQNEVVLPASISPTQDYTNIDVTALVQDMINIPTQSFGFMLQLQNETFYRRLIFASSDHPNAQLHPKLVITYQVSNPTICKVLQPGRTECSDGKDAFIGDCVACGYYSTNFGSHEDFIAISWTNGGNQSNGRSLLEFDLSVIPPGSTLNSASLSLYHNSSSTSNVGHSQLSGANEATLSRIVDPWNENTVTWANQPSTTTVNQVVLPASTSNTQDYLNIDVTAMVTDMLNNPTQSHGFMLQLVTESYYRSMLFCSSDHADDTKHPKLELCYTPSSSGATELNPGNVSVFPNPVNGSGALQIHVMNHDASFSLYDVIGRLIITEKLSEGNSSIHLPNLTPGMYGVRIITSGMEVIRKLVVN